MKKVYQKPIIEDIKIILRDIIASSSFVNEEESEWLPWV